MNTHKPLYGIHHITAIAASAAENVAFYEQVLGLRLVKKTVNFDDPHTYHLYYGDAQGSPGTILTFFPWERLAQGRPGAGMVTAVAFSVPSESIDYWLKRLETNGLDTTQEYRFGETVVQFKDPHGLNLELIEITQSTRTAGWPQGPVENKHAIQGFHSATTLLTAVEPTRTLLTDTMGMVQHGREGNRHRFLMQGGPDPGQIYDVVVDPTAASGRIGGGCVHHIAFRTPGDQDQGSWQSVLRRSGMVVTNVRDRNYFRSIYFHEPGGVLFEIATDTPGFAVDESPDSLGQTLKLPVQYEPMRLEIAGQLPMLRSRKFQHVFKRSGSPNDNAQTIVALHGTGGDENDLLGFARQIEPNAAVLGVRGQVLENGMPRFFRRLSDGIFDEADVNNRAHHLADFLTETTSLYGHSNQAMIALGYSNGANMAAAVMLVRPDTFSKAILIRPMLPLNPPTMPDLTGKSMLILRGRYDGVISGESTDRLARLLAQSGAKVDEVEIEAGHEITAADLEMATQWLAKVELHAMVV